MKRLVLLAGVLLSMASSPAEAKQFGVFRWLGLGFGDGIHAEANCGGCQSAGYGTPGDVWRESPHPGAEPMPATPEPVPHIGTKTDELSARSDLPWYQRIRLLPPSAPTRADSAVQ